MGVKKIYTAYDVFDRVKLEEDTGVYVIVSCNINHTESECVTGKVSSKTSTIYAVRRITADGVGETKLVTYDKIVGYYE